MYVCMYVCMYVGMHVTFWVPGRAHALRANVKLVRFRDPWPYRTHPSCFSSLLRPHGIRTIEPYDYGGVYNRAVRRLHVVDIARMPRPVHYHGPERWRQEAATIDPAG